MEGVAAEACSLAGHLGLGKLIVLYDQNHISLVGLDVAVASPRTSARGSPPTAGTCSTWTTGTTSPQSTRRSRGAGGRRQAVHHLVRTIIGFGAPHKQNTYEAHGSPLGADELRAAKEALGLADRARVLDSGGGRGALPDRGGARPDRRARLARATCRLPRGSIPTSPTSSSGASAATCLPAGTATCRRSPPTTRGWRPARPRSRSCSGWPPHCRSSWAAPPISIRRRTPGSRPSEISSLRPRAGRRAGRDRRSVGSGRPQPALRRARARDGSDRERARAARRLHPVRRDVPRLLGLHASRDPARRASAGSGPSGSIRTTASASARTVRRISRWSTTPLCAPFRICSSSAPVTPTRRRWPGRSPSRRRHGPTVLALTRQNLPTLDRSRFASADGLRQGAYVLNPAVDRPDLLLLATGSELHLVVAAAALLEERGVRARDRLDALLGALRGAAGLLSRRRPATADHGTRRRRDGRLARLASLDRLAWRPRDARSLRRLGAGPRVLTELGFTAANVADRAARLLG